MCCRACSGYGPGKAAMIDFFDAEEPSAALIMAFDPRYAPGPDCYLREGGSISPGLTLRVAAESRGQSREQTSRKSGSPIRVKDTSILRPYRDRGPFPSSVPIAVFPENWYGHPRYSARAGRH
jgi:hypothetical protein